MEKTTGPSAVARLGNPVAHPSVAESGAACAVRGVSVCVRFISLCVKFNHLICVRLSYLYLCGYLADGGEDGVLVRRVSRLAGGTHNLHGAGGGDGHGVGGEHCSGGD